MERLERLSHFSDHILNGIPRHINQYAIPLSSLLLNTHCKLCMFRIGKNNYQPSIVMKFIPAEARNKFYSSFISILRFCIYAREAANAEIFRVAMVFDLRNFNGIN